MLPTTAGMKTWPTGDALMALVIFAISPLVNGVQVAFAGHGLVETPMSPRMNNSGSKYTTGEAGLAQMRGIFALATPLTNRATKSMKDLLSIVKRLRKSYCVATAR